MKKTLGELFRVVATLAFVVGTLAAALAGADVVPRWLGGVPAGVVRATSVSDAERRLGARIAVPPYFPDSLAWPPARVQVIYGPPAAVALSFTGRHDGDESLVLVETLSAGALPPELWPPVTRMSSSRVAVGGEDVELWRVLGPDGAFWQELVFPLGERRVGLRSRGTIEDLVRMARSLEHALP